MDRSARDSVIAALSGPLRDYASSFEKLLRIGGEIENSLQDNFDILTAIRGRFDNLSAHVELEFEGTSVFDEEIKRAHDFLQQSIRKFGDAGAVTNRIQDDLRSITDRFERIKRQEEQLNMVAQNINIVAEAIEVASRNAGITAFHAGKHGRGFEIIAREMTDLVQSSHSSTQVIPRVSSDIVRRILELQDNLRDVGNIVAYLKDIGAKFDHVTTDLLSFVPETDKSIKDVSGSIALQRDYYQQLLKENEVFTRRLTEIANTTRRIALNEIFLAAVLQHTTDIQEMTLGARDAGAFATFSESLNTVMNRALVNEERVLTEMSREKYVGLDTQSSDRLIVQFVTESNHLSDIIAGINANIHNWTKTNELGLDILNKGLAFYQDIVELLGTLNRRVGEIREATQRIDQPLNELRRITERSRILGLYAGIESARSGAYATSLGVVTREIKNLASKTAGFVSEIGEIEEQIYRDFSALNASTTKCISDVEQGIGYLKLALADVTENKRVLANLEGLCREMRDSTQGMVEQSHQLEDRIKTFSVNYSRGTDSLNRYAETIRSSIDAARRAAGLLEYHQKNVQVLERPSRTLVFRESTDPLVLDPAHKTDSNSHLVISQIFSGLMAFNSSNKLVPAVADNFSVSADGCTWDFTIKQDVRFHDGRRLTAQDVVRSIQRVRQGPNSNFVDCVADVLGRDDSQVRFVMKYPYLTFLANLACGVCDITPENFNPDRPVGCGPYRLVEWEKGRQLVFEASETYFDRRVAIDRLIIRIIPNEREALAAYRNGEVHLMELGSTEQDAFEPQEVVSGPVLSTQYLGMNQVLDTPFRDKRVRQAVNHAIDKELYVRTILNGRAMPARGIFPPGMQVHNANLAGYAFDLARARSLMQEAGFPAGIETPFLFDVRDDDGSRQRAEFFKGALERIGINININPLPWRDLLEKVYRGESVLSSRGWVSDNGDPDNFLFPLFHSRSAGRAGNTTFYSNSAIDRMIEAARTEQSTKARIAMCRRIEEMIVEDAPWVFLSHGVTSYLCKPTVRGFKVDPFGIVRFRYLWME